MTKFPKGSYGARKIVEVEITTACNLNCKGCYRGASGSYFMPLKSLDKIRERFKNEIRIFHINGGEPTLHPQIKEIIKKSSAYFKDADIVMITNGAKLNTIPLPLLQKLSKIRFSHYPGRNDKESNYGHWLAKKGINITISKIDYFENTNLTPRAQNISPDKVSKVYLSCINREYRISEDKVFNCCYHPTLSKKYRLLDGIPLDEFNLDINLESRQLCDFCWHVIYKLNPRTPGISPASGNPKFPKRKFLNIKQWIKI